MIHQRMSRRTFLSVSAMTAATLALDWRRISACASRIHQKADYPVVIIGAGLGGLCCGAYLARQGIPVTLVEQHDVPGGYATSFDRGAGKFTFEVSLHGTSIHHNDASRCLHELGVLKRLKLAPLPEVYRLKAPGLDISVPQRNPEAYITLLSRRFPNEADGIRSFVKEMTGLSEEVDRFSKKRGRFIKILFPFRYPKMWNIRNQTLAQMLDAHVKDPELQHVLSALWGYYGLPPSELSAFYYANATGGYLRNGSYYIEKRSQALSHALADSIQEAGGIIRYETPAERIVLKDRAVAGVKIAGGDILPARAVVSNASALTTFKKMLPPHTVPADYLSKLAGYKPSISSFIVWLGLNQELRGKIPGFTTHVASGRGPEADYRSCIRGDVEEGGFSVSIYDNIFRGYSSPGTSTLMLLFLSGYEPWRRFEEDYRAGRKEAYHREKDRWTNILIERSEKEVVPNLSAMIDISESATPLTNWRYTRNPQGAIYGFEQSMDNAFMNRIKNRTPIKGLYLAGAWGAPGGGIAGVLRSGQSTFTKILEDWG
ncbi:MAG: NAD(P)/FAD-dependent oxidoreductase [Deltaproteobacteria bacterium]|nr:NAD(P)/FAD-dependent oxidoreductase [Deltaproteobacteria bacterium]